MLLECLKEVSDHRRAQGQRYELHYILFFAIVAMMSGAISFRKIDLFIKAKFQILKSIYQLKWKSPPSESNIRKIFKNMDQASLEEAFRLYSAWLSRKNAPKEGEFVFISCDGKQLKSSYDNFSDKEAISCLSALCGNSNIILGHKFITGKEHEIPKFQELIAELGLKNCVWTADALHTQKNS